MALRGFVLSVTCVVLIGELASSASADARHGPPHAARIPFVYEDARIYVPVRIGAGQPRWFILDTGASGTIIDRAVANAAHLTIKRGQRVSGAGAGSTLQDRTAALELHVGNVPLRVSDAGILDLANLLGATSGRAPAGIIGGQFFLEHFVDIDFASRQITVTPPNVQTGTKYSASVPLTFVQGTPLTDVLLALPDQRIVRAHALVDLGAKSTFLVPEPFIARTKLRESVGKTVTTGFGAGVGGDTFYAFTRAKRLSLASADQLGVDQPVIGLSVGGTLRSTWNQGLLGSEFLSRFRLGFDYRHKRLWLGHAQANPPVFDRSGLFLVATGPALDRIIVRQVLRDGPADQAGLAARDEILTIDGVSVGELRLAGIRQRLKEPGDRTVTVGYRRGSAAGKVRLKLRDLV